MNFVTTRAVMSTLGIEDWDYSDDRLEFPINDWLARNNRLNVRAGSIKHPRSTSESPDEDGMLLMTRFIEGSNIVIEERSEDKAIKDRLIQEGGIQANELEWVSLQDRFSLTRTGTLPERDTPRVFVRRVVSHEQAERWFEYNKNSGKPSLSLGEFVVKEDEEAQK